MFLPTPNPIEPPWYGPVCPVVWEGWRREVSPYPDRFKQLERFRQALVAFRCAGGCRGHRFADRLLDTRQRFRFAGGDQSANECCLLGLLLLEALETLGTDRRRRCDQRLDPLKSDHADQRDDRNPDQLGYEVPGRLELYRRQRKGFDLAMAGDGG
jgi:hypothetical protein